MFEHLDNPQEAFNHKLGATLKMEQKVLGILEENMEQAHDPRVRELFGHHHEETRQHVANVERAFELMGWEIDDSPSPAIEGLEKEGKANAKKSDDAIIDAVLLEGAVEVEHHEIGAYENLIINAQAMGRDDVVSLLGLNLESEQHTLEEVKQMEALLAAAAPA